MYSRFVTWQRSQNVSGYVESADVNQFIINDDLLDVRFSLKGYGFKKIGEQNRIVHHFGCYKCYYRKYGETDWNLFAHVACERNSSEAPTVYKDVFVSSGVLPQAKYEVKIVACRLVELENWTGGIVEGIASGDRFHYGIEARQNVPLKVKATDNIIIESDFLFGLDPMDLSTGQAYEDITYAVDLAIAEVEIGLDVVEFMIVEDTVNAQRQ